MVRNKEQIFDKLKQDNIIFTSLQNSEMQIKKLLTYFIEIRFDRNKVIFNSSWHKIGKNELAYCASTLIFQ